MILEMYNDVLRNLRSGQDLLVIDLARELPKQEKYFYDSVHFGNQGAQEVAKMLDRSLVPYWIKKFAEFKK